MGAELRAGLVGLGMMGRNHARVLSGLDGVDFIGAADPVGDVHQFLGSVPLFASLDELIAAGIDMCVVALPTEFHLEAGLKLADAKVAALIEKPLAASTQECRELSAAFAAAGVVACVGHIERFNPAIRAAKLRLEAGELGEIYQISTRRQGPFPHRIKDVGVVKDLATHDIDLAGFLAGSSYASVAARTAHKTGRAFEDMVAVTAEMHNGIVVNHVVNWLSPVKERMTLVTGDRGAFQIDTLTADLTFSANGSVATEWDAISNFRGVSEGDVSRFAIPKPEPLAVELSGFRDAVLGVDGAAIVSVDDGLRAVAVAEACLESASSGRTIDLEAPQ